jgi:iron complex transport system substrate-binding protein
VGVRLDRRRFLGAALTLTTAGAASRGRSAPAPSRIVSMDYGLTETMLALGAAPLAMPDAQDWSTWVVEPPLPASVQNLGSDQEVNLELLVSLKPDLILVTPYLDDLTPTLERIAPCERLAIYEEGGASPLPRAEEVTGRIGALLGAPARAARYLEASRAQFEADRNRLAAAPRAPLLLVNVIDARNVRVYGAKSLWQDVLDRLGWPNAWTRPTSYWGFATVGVEELAAAGADATLVAFEPIPPDALPTLNRSPLWRDLPFVKNGRILKLAPAFMFGAVPSARRFSRLLTAALADAAPTR